MLKKDLISFLLTDILFLALTIFLASMAFSILHINQAYLVHQDMNDFLIFMIAAFTTLSLGIVHLAIWRIILYRKQKNHR